METVKFKNFSVKVSNGNFSIEREGHGSIDLMPSDVSIVRELCGWAAPLQESPVYPSPLRSYLFELYFHEKEDNSIELELKRANEKSGIKFTFEILDDFLCNLEDSLAVYQNYMVHNSKALRASQNVSFGPGDPLV